MKMREIDRDRDEGQVGKEEKKKTRKRKRERERRNEGGMKRNNVCKEREKRKKEIIFILVSTTFLIKLLGLSSKLLAK